jgi:hypothetical protein
MLRVSLPRALRRTAALVVTVVAACTSDRPTTPVADAPDPLLNQPASFVLTRLDGAPVPTIVDASLASFDGVDEYRELYVELGSLELSPGAQPRYSTSLHYAWYAVTFDSTGQRHFLLREARDIDDHGSVTADANGSLTFTSDVKPSVMHTASADTSGLLMQYHVEDVTKPIVLNFHRAP